MVVFPQAKINIGLRILRKRTDGYHDIESLFYPIPLYDVLEIITDDGTEGFSLEQSGLNIGTSSGNNLVEKAWMVLAGDHALSGMRAWLHKVLPMGAGLGGGSSDGAWALKVMNDIAGLGLSDETLESYASVLGSDCPFFIKGRPAWVTGRGEVMAPSSLSLTGFYLVLVCPDIHVATVDAYANILPDDSGTSLSNLLELPVAQWRENIQNDFEDPVFRKYPALKKVKEKLYKEGAVYASMTGSGSALYGIFEHEPTVSRKVFPWPVYTMKLD
ncbi:MAG: 4-(cytidine 5'-diphospho)-2-C-methyl-D-erythritol kinase [Flavobacteriales bacterium]|nr:4-(cytidine 5'-diphospho)-2-C-methyl-D-erythritol kinase [Flavobacteriales bacterium]